MVGASEVRVGFYSKYIVFHKLCKTYNFAYAKYVVLLMYMVLHAAPVQTRARIDDITSIQRGLNILKRALPRYLNVTSSRGGGGWKRLPKFKFSVEFPIGLHVILQLQIKKIQNCLLSQVQNHFNRKSVEVQPCTPLS